MGFLQDRSLRKRFDDRYVKAASMGAMYMASQVEKSAPLDYWLDVVEKAEVALPPADAAAFIEQEIKADMLAPETRGATVDVYRAACWLIGDRGIATRPPTELSDFAFRWESQPRTWIPSRS